MPLEVPGVRIELTRGCPRGILSPLRLPFRHPGKCLLYIVNPGRVERASEDLGGPVVIASYPSRDAILTDAFEAHRKGKYTLSVPVFLAQADGIFAEESRGGPTVFMERERKTAAADHSDRAPVTVVKRWLDVFGNVLPLWMSRKDRSSASFEGLNRHLVLHGESVDYHTEENSLKAISLLHYFDMLFSEIRAVEKEDHRKQRELSRGEGLDLGEGK